MIAALPPSAAAAAGPGSVNALIAFLLIALGISSICSLAEAALLSVSDAQVKYLVKKKKRGSNRLEAARANMARPIAAILTLNTIAHTLGVAGVGAEAALIFGQEWIGVVSAILTLLILVISEMIPKTIGARFASTLAAPMAIFVNWITVALKPIIVISEFFSKWIERIPKRETDGDGTIAEVAAAQVDVALEKGHVDSWQGQLMHNVIRLNEITAREIMTPRTVVFSLPETTTVSEFHREHGDCPFTRIPIYEGSDPSNLVGYVLRGDILATADKKAPLKSFIRKLNTEFDQTTASELFRKLGATRVHIAMVVNEHGILSGIVTMEDIVEEMLGHEIVDERDVHADMREHARQVAGDSLDEENATNDESALAEEEAPRKAS